MKKAMILVAAMILYTIIDVSCFFTYFLNPYIGWSFVTALLLTAYTLFAMRYVYKKVAFPWWGTWLCVVPCGTLLIIAALILIQPLAPSAPLYGATSLLFILWGSVVKYIVWMAIAVIAGCVFLPRYLKK